MTPRDLASSLRGLVGRGLETREQVRRYQSHRLRALVRHAYERVPYYRHLFDRAGLSPRDIRGVDDLRRIPTTERGDLQLRSRDDVCARGAAYRINRVIRTSGSSGAPLTVYRTMAEERLMQAYRAKAVGAWGFGPRARRANVDHLSPEVAKSETEPERYERFGIMPRLNLDWRAPTDEIIDRIAAFGPDLISGPPSILADLADQLDEGDRAGIGARRVLTGAEQLTPAARERIQHGFGLPVSDIYGCHEVVFIAMEAPGVRGYRVCDEAVIVEVIDGKTPSRRGEIVVTGLHQRSMPFIRYRLGDYVEVLDDTGPRLVLRSIEGRVTDRFRLPDGSRVHGYTLGELIETSGLPVTRFQITQERRDSFRVRLVIAGTAPPDLAPLRARLAACLGSTCVIELERVDTIERSSRKFYPFVSLERAQSQ